MKSPRLRALRKVFVTTFLVLLIVLPMLKMPKSLAFLLALASAGWVTWLKSVLDNSGKKESLEDRLHRRERQLKAKEDDEPDDPPY